MNRDEIFEKFVKENILLTSEVCEILGVSRQQVSNLVRQGKITPIKENANASLFLKADIDEYIARKMAWNIHRTNEIIGNGSTSNSREQFKSIKELYNDIIEVHLYLNKQEAMFDGYYTLCGRYQRDTLLRLDAPTCVMRLVDGREFWYDGYNCGYGGTGPNGSYNSLLMLGISKKDASEIFNTEKISFYREGNEWQVVNRGESIINKDYPWMECKICLYNDRLVLVQDNEEKHKKEMRYQEFLEKYSFFVPRPIEVTFLSKREALNTGHYVSSFNYSGIYQIIIKDISGNELWLDYQLDESVPINKQQNIESILKKIGIDIPDNKNSISDKIREWLGIKPVITDMVSYSKEKN